MSKKVNKMSNAMIALAIRAAEQLQGSSNSLADLGTEYEDAELDATFCAKLDELVFCCTCCDNWFEQSEMSEQDWVCDGCADGQ